jgi:hypothetical protein
MVGADGIEPPTQEYLIRHTLESFLDRLSRTAHAGDFVLKGRGASPVSWWGVVAFGLAAAR